MKNYSTSSIIVSITFVIITVLACPFHRAIAQDRNTEPSLLSDANYSDRINAFSALNLEEKREFFKNLDEKDKANFFEKAEFTFR